MKNQKIVILCSLDLYFRGTSLREVQQHLKSTFGCEVSYVTIYNWLKKYIRLVKTYTETLRLDTSDRWHADETLIRVKSRQMVLWNLLDSQTKQLIAKHISETRGKEDAVILFKKGKEKSINPPKELVTDALPSYNFATDDQFGSNPTADPNQKTIHIVGPLFGAINNNKIERFNGSVKGRLKPMGHLSSNEGADLFADGYEIHYNYIREHQALNGKTPYGASKGLTEELNWRQLIDKASRAKDSNVPP
jgi:transposase-like protein